MSSLVTRLAPSPTGAMHLGNARTFMLTAWWAYSDGATSLLRIEDLDHPRKKPHSIESIREDLQWMGVNWDFETPIQSTRHASHLRALEALRSKGDVYVCKCTRQDVIDAQSAPHESLLDLVYPGTCRAATWDPRSHESNEGKALALRFRVPATPVSFDDRVFGPQTVDLARQSGDFVVGRIRADGEVEVGYQLAVVTDDAEDGVTHVLRGADLLLSAARQRAIQTALDLPTVTYAHFPLVVGTDGRRLAKRHGDTRLASLRDDGMTAERLWRWVASTISMPAATQAEVLSRQLNLSNIPRDPVVLTGRDLAWLCGRE